MSTDKQSRIDAIFQSYRNSLPNLMAELTLLQEKLNTEWDIDQAVEFDRKVHNLAGSAATFELEKIGTAARKLEQSFKPLVHAEYNAANPRLAESNQLLVLLRATIESDLADSA